jgi:hypothetical protein
MDHFHHLMEYQLAVCKECQYAIWPEQIGGHLHGKHHKLSQKKAQEIAEEVRGWPGLISFANELQIPVRVDQPIPQLPLYEDGLMCQLESQQCQYICRDKKTLKKHWRTKHQWSIAQGRGGLSKAKKQSMEKRFEEVAKQVHCQRFFLSHDGSQYFEVCMPEKAQDEQARVVVGDELWDQLRDRALKCWAEVEEESQKTIKEVQTREANPWLERTGWSKYLKKLERMELLESIRAPDNEADVEGEVVEMAIWKTMGEVAKISQVSIINRAGVNVRMEAVRTEKHQTKYHPLQAYQYEEEIEDHVRPWRQILMFFARTQKEHDWRSPKYRFTNAQQQAWNELIEEAKRVSDKENENNGNEEEEEENEEEEEEDEEEEEEEDEDEEDIEDEEEDEEEQEDMQEKVVETNQIKPEPLTGIQEACLDFCIELLNQRTGRHEYNSALVCALAVLGVNEDGWKGPDRYPPILSNVIKIARFMVVQEALEIACQDDEDEFNNDMKFNLKSEKNSHRSNHPVPVPVSTIERINKDCLELVTTMMDSFMIRGSQSPMQWMLDLRTYGMKIHYNTTAIGHIGWHGYDEILYKHIQFNMSQFRCMIHGLVEQCRQMMEEELLFCGRKYGGKQMPKVSWKSIRDNPTNEQSGWNFLKDQRTRMPVDGDTWLWNHMKQDDTIKQQFSRVGSQSGMNQECVRAYMKQVTKFKEKLLILIHITGKSVSYN